jgi:hypothetical protein
LGAPDPTVILLIDFAASKEPLKPGAVVGKKKARLVLADTGVRQVFGDCWTLHSHILDSVDLGGRRWLFQILCCKTLSFGLHIVRGGRMKDILNPLPTLKIVSGRSAGVWGLR